MSTRAQIVVEGNEAIKIYKHCDGYPEEVIPTLATLLPLFKKDRGWDCEYLTAHISAAFIMDSLKEYPNSFSGHGLDTQWHGDIAYAYRVNRDFSVSVLKVGFGNDPDFSKAERIELEKLSSYKEKKEENE